MVYFLSVIFCLFACIGFWSAVFFVYMFIKHRKALKALFDIIKYSKKVK